MNPPTSPATGFFGDLWHAGRPIIESAAHALMRDRGYTVRRVHSLGSGLYVTVELTDGSQVNLYENEIKSWAWAEEARQNAATKAAVPTSPWAAHKPDCRCGQSGCA